jgi:hypothetical protein
MAQETGTLPEPIRTPLTVSNDRITFYFRTRFHVAGLPPLASFSLRQIVDDGVVFYLNGAELSRTRLPMDPVLFDTLAETQPADPAPYEGPFSLVATAMVAGSNVLAAEVHQSSATSSDIVFGGELTLVVGSLALPPEEPRLSLALTGPGQVRLSWTGGPAELEQASIVTGPWTRAAVQSNPQPLPVISNQFFRLRL